METISSGFNFAAQEPMAPRISRKRYMAGARSAYKRFPPSKFGTVYLKRGQPDSVAMFGSSYASATDAQKAARRNYGWRGAGLYGGQGAYSLRSLGRSAGSIIGKSLGNASIGSAIGGSIGGAASRYLGMGEYQDNQLISGGRMSMQVAADNDETDTITITDCEFVKDIFAPNIAAGSSTFASQTLPVNPGITGFAPNLSQLACNYTEYELKQLVYELRPVISENNVNNGQSGIAMMVFNYNPNDDPYDNKEDVMQAHGSISGRIVDSLRCGVECHTAKVNKTKFFIRTGPVPAGRDVDEYDHGVLTIATNNIPAAFSNTQIYELWVYYTVTLRKRKPGAIRLINQQRDWWIATGDRSYNDFSAAITDTTSNGIAYAQQSNLGGRLTRGTNVRNITYTFPADFNGVVELTLLIEGASLSGTNMTTSTTGNVSLVSDMFAAGGGGDLPDNTFTVNGVNNWGGIVHAKVRSATGSTDNSITFVTTGLATGSVTSWFFDVKEYTNQFWTNKSNYVPYTVNYQTGIPQPVV